MSLVVKTRWWYLLLPVMTYMMVACSSSSSKNAVKPEALPDTRQFVTTKKRWTRTVGSGLGKYYQTITPALDEEYIYAADRNGRVKALDRKKGTTAWSTNIKASISGGVGSGGDLVLVGTVDGELVALDRLKGEPLWRAEVSSEILSPPQTNGSVVVVQTSDGKLFGFSATDGKQLWLYSVALPVLTLRGTAAPIITGNTVVAGFANGKVVALAARSGSFLWEQRIARPTGRTELERIIDINGSPALANDIVFVTSYQGRLVAMSRANGRILWSKESSSYQGPVVINGRVYVVGQDSHLYAYEAATGRVLWENKQLLNRQLSPPQGVSGFLAVSDYQGYLHIIDPEAGVILGRTRIDSEGVRSPMATDGTYLYVLGNDGRLASVAVHLLRP